MRMNVSEYGFYRLNMLVFCFFLDKKKFLFRETGQNVKERGFYEKLVRFAAGQR